MTVDQLHSIRRRVHAALAAALLASVAANVLAAEPTIEARAVAAWPPVALMLVVDVLGRAPTATGWTGRIAVASAGLVALVAGLASFSHVRAVALAVGESELVAWVLPLSVDGLAVVCSVALVEINRQLNTTHLETDPHLEIDLKPSPEPDAEPVAVEAPELVDPAPVAAPVPDVAPVVLPVPLSPMPAVSRPVSV